MIHVEIVTPTRARLRPFVMLPFSLYKDDANWVPPMLERQYGVLLGRRNELFHNGVQRFFLVYDGDKPVARVLAIVDETLQEKTGYVSLFESYDNVDYAKAALDAACAFLRERGMERVVGPVPPTYDRFSKGMLVSGFDGQPVLFNAYNPPYYANFFKQFGFTKNRDYFAYYLNVDDFKSDRIAPLVEPVQKRFGFTVSHMTLNAATLDKMARDMARVIREASPVGQTPPTPETLRKELKSMRPYFCPDMAVMAFAGERPIGFVLGYPDYNQIIKKARGRLLPGALFYLFGRKNITGARCTMQYVVPEYQNKAVNGVMLHKALTATKRLGVQWIEGSPVDETNIVSVNNTEKAGGSLYRVYREYQMPL